MNVKTKDLKSVFPIGAIENDCILSKWAEITVAFEVTLSEIFTLNVTKDDNGAELGDYQELISTWDKAISVLPAYTTVHKQDWFVKDSYTTSEDSDSYLDQSSELHFNERAFLDHKCYLFVTKTHRNRGKMSYLHNSLIRGNLVPKTQLKRDAVDSFLANVSQMVSILESTGHMKLRRLLNDDLQPLERNESGLLERYMSLSLNEKVVSLKDLEIEDDTFKIGSFYSKFFTISDIDDLPDTLFTNSRVSTLSSENSNISVGFAAPLGLMLNCNHIYNQYVIIEEKSTLIRELEGKAQNMKSLSNFGRANEINAGLVSEFLSYSARENLSPVKIHMNLQVWTERKSELPTIKNEVTSAIAQMGLKPRESSRDSAFLFWAAIPGNAGELPKEDTFHQFVPHAACLFNHETIFRDTQFSGFGVKVADRLTGKPQWVDMSDKPMDRKWITNRNKFIIGPSGSGKSFLTNHFLRSYYMQGSHIVLIDVGHSYAGLCKLLGGKYLTYTDENPINFNPFYVEGRVKPDIEKIEAIKTLLTTLWKREDEKVSMSEYNAITNLVSEYYKYLDEERTVFPCLNTFYDFTKVKYREIAKKRGLKDHYFDIENFLFNLGPYYQGGEFEHLLNSETNLDLLHERFIVFELDNIKDHPILFPIVTIIIMDTFISKMRKLEGIRKIILIEEAWKAIMKDGMAEYIKYLYKTVRKFYGEAWIVTQEIDDIIGSKIIKEAIVNNADTKILLDQRKYTNKFKHVQELLSLSEKEKNLCLSLNKDNDPKRNYKEFFVSFNGQVCQVYGLEVSESEYYAYTTEQKEKLLIEKQAQENGGDYELAIKQVVEGKKRSA